MPGTSTTRIEPGEEAAGARASVGPFAPRHETEAGVVAPGRDALASAHRHDSKRPPASWSHDVLVDDRRRQLLIADDPRRPRVPQGIAHHRRCATLR
jgi:hypothetical protein